MDLYEHKCNSCGYSITQRVGMTMQEAYDRARNMPNEKYIHAKPSIPMLCTHCNELVGIDMKQLYSDYKNEPDQFSVSCPKCGSVTLIKSKRVCPNCGGEMSEKLLAIFD